MFDKFEARCELARKVSGRSDSAYAWLHYHNNHPVRYKRYVKSLPHPLLCQDCGGSGEHVDDHIDWYDIMVQCGWCQGVGLVTPHIRGQWLQHKREYRQMIESIKTQQPALS